MNEQDSQFAAGSGGAEATLHLRRRERSKRARAARASASQPHKVPGWGFWVLWALASGIVGFAPVLVRLAESAVEAGEGAGAILVPWVLAVLIGLLCALAQWAVLYPYIPTLSPVEWVRAIMIGFLVAGLLCIGSLFATLYVIILYMGSLLFFVNGHTPDMNSPEVATPYAILNMLLLFVGVGISAVIGSAQWVALRRYLPNSKQLIISNMIAAIVFQLSALLYAYATTGVTAFEGEALRNTIISGWIATLFLSGTITGVTLVRILRRPIEAETV